MEENKLEPAHFYWIFQKKMTERIYNANISKLSDDDMDPLDCINIHSINRVDLKPLILNAMNDMCMEYLNESDSNINVIPDDTFELVDYILNEEIESPYKDNFIFSLNFVHQYYLDFFGKGSPSYRSSEDDTGVSELLMEIDHKNQINSFESVNLSKEETAKIIMGMFRMDYNNQLGPYHPKVHMKKVSWR